MEKKATRSLVREILGWIAPSVFGVLCVFLCTHFVFYLPTVSGSSMENSFRDGDVLLCTRVYRPEDLQRYDVVTLTWNGTQIVKRIYGLPGEELSVSPLGEILVDGVPIEDPYAKENTEDFGRLLEGVTLLEGEYFLLGDNRAVSDDSRFHVGIVRFSQILGKVRFRLW